MISCHCFTKKVVVFSVAYRSVKLVKVEILEGIGPSKPQPCICLKKHFFLFVYLLEDKKVLVEKDVILQFHYSCPIADEIWYSSSEIIITYPPTNPASRISKQCHREVIQKITKFDIRHINHVKTKFSYISDKFVSNPSFSVNGPVKAFEVRWLR